MRVVLLRDYQNHKAGTSLVVPTNEGDWLVRCEIACDPADFKGVRNTSIKAETVDTQNFGDRLVIDDSVVAEAVDEAKKAVRKAIKKPKG